MRTLKFAVFFCLSLILCGKGFAQQESTDQPSSAEKITTTAVTPEAAALGVEWWKFFELAESSPSIFKSRIQALEKSLDSRIASLSAETQASALELRNRIISNLHALLFSGAQKPAEPAAIRSFKESYSIEQWLELERLHRDKQKELSDEQAAIEQLTKALEAAVKKYDNEMATYIGIPATASDKAIRGMEIMVTRTALALAQQRLSRYRKALNYLTTALDALSNEKRVAAERLSVTTQTLSALTKQRLDQEQRLSNAISQLNGVQSRALGAISETPEAIADSRLQEQRVIAAAAEETLARLNLATTDGIIALTRMQAKQPIDADELHKQLDSWQRLSKESATQLNGWRAASLREQNRSQTQLLSQPPPALKAIHQARNDLAQQTQLKLVQLNELRLTLTLLIDRCLVTLSQQEGVLKHGWISALRTLKSGWQLSASLVTDSLFKIGETPVTILGLLRVVLILTVAWTLSSLLRRMLAKIAASHDSEGSALYTVGRLAHYVILVTGMVIALSSIGLDFGNLALVAGALSVGIGFGLQSIVNNFVSGLILLFERSLKVGDFIELDSGVRGIIVDINVRSTLINTNDNVDIIVPNSELVGTKVTNWTLRDATRRMRIPFGVAYGSDKERVKAAALEAADRVPVTLRTPAKHAPQVWLVGFGDSSLNFELVVWVSQAAVKRPSGVTAAYLWEIETSLQQHGIEIPFPQRDLNIRSLFDKRGAEAEAILRTPL